MGSLKSIELFLALYASRGKSLLEDTTRDDLEAFVESEQDRGLKITSVRARLKYLFGFLRFLVEQEVIPERMLGLKIRIKVPDMLPRAMNPDDVRKLFSVIDHTRDRALILMLLRTGMRIGEALALIMNDIDIAERKIYIFEGKKNGLGRVVYLSADAVFALKRWFARRDEKKVAVFYGRGYQTLAYSSARALFTKYIGKARLERKGYTIHSLRHTFASELLNAGMRLECLQQLLGHHNTEMTRRYARLTDITREEEYFRAITMVEGGGIDGHC